MALPNVYDWNRIRAALGQLHGTFPGLLENIVLIGGGACWFYREALNQWHDRDFTVPRWTPSELTQRLHAGIPKLDHSKHKAIFHWAKHHLPA